MNAPVFIQIQLLLSALAALLPLTPVGAREKLAAVLDLAAGALRAVQAGAGELDDLAVKLRHIRADIERLVEEGRAVSAIQLDEAFARVEAASAAFRAALQRNNG